MVQFKISQPLLCKIFKTREDLLRQTREIENTDCKGNSCEEEVAKALKLRFTYIRELDSPITGPLMRQKAEYLATKMGQKEFVPTEGMQKEEHEDRMSTDEDIPVAAPLTDLEICQPDCKQDQTIKVDDSEGTIVLKKTL
ncbi:hypothetical protein AVEN_172058-1 [Araneus ventricosus]|uniref:Uncharacterized protein n=1 Tax=Araneus ventricosus TaxID=182803 RepID=A0A4Y2W3J5_ARAVE|nr:hypothetical protein AVEN_253243-1 [Araneus ventricosus]GBO31855.1 hypothetical protein AVEN_43861-1 [Araneus ventricosus]GBO31881.1 hypothetical protein AVEN_172058-1 [Araneus ventricosus]